MGFFSKDCEGCGHPLLSKYATNRVNKWMEQAVAILPDNEIVVGEYDGYGRIDGIDHLIFGAMVYHEACWREADCPKTFVDESCWSEDQGYFFDDGAHDMPEPTGLANRS